MAVEPERDARPFAGATATFYARYRRRYPAELLQRLRQFGRDGRGRLLDLGCGTGQLSLQLAPYFAEVIGLDPEPDMLHEAQRATGEHGLRNVRYLTAGSGELRELTPTLGTFNLVTIGTAFHFMAPRTTLAQLREIAPEGAVAVAYSGSPIWLHPDPWAQALRSVLETRLGPLADTDFTLAALQTAENTMRDLRYAHVERWEQTSTDTIDLDFVVGHILSAVSAEQIPDAERENFSHDVHAAITAVEPSGRIVETVTNEQRRFSASGVRGRLGCHEMS